MKKIGLYIHIPFCKSKCPYCDFYSLKKGEHNCVDYVLAVKASLKNWAQKTRRKADTLYFGGGTPSLLGGDKITELVAAAKEHFVCDGEVTVECNPSCVEDNFFEKIACAGVNRISLGMQSAVNDERKRLGRLADVRAVEGAIRLAQNAGIDNISLDVMLGIPGQNPKSLEETLSFCVSSGAKHISAYMLKLEEGTWFYENVQKLNLPDDDLTADMYLQMVDFLGNNGFEQYEISNFAKVGYESRHNLKYWNCEEYLGIGPSAHSFLDGKRFFYPRDISFFESGGDSVADGDGGGLEEYIMLRLRLSEGLVFEQCEKRFADFSKKEYLDKVEPLKRAGLVRADEKSISLTPRGFLISNAVIEKIIF